MKSVAYKIRAIMVNEVMAHFGRQLHHDVNQLFYTHFPQEKTTRNFIVYTLRGTLK